MPCHSDLTLVLKLHADAQPEERLEAVKVSHTVPEETVHG